MTIKITETTYDALTLYRKANTDSQRALAGYIIKSGKINDPIFGGAFDLLRCIERCNETGEIYELYSLVDPETKKKIKHVAQIAIDGKFDKFMISERECQHTIKCLCEPF